MAGIWILTGMFVLIGALFTWLGYGNLASARKKRASWIAVQGTVTDGQEEGGAEIGERVAAQILPALGQRKQF